MHRLYIAPDDWLTILFRLCLALFVGAIIGIERQRRHKPAGLRTHMLVCFGAALFTLIPLLTGNGDKSYQGEDALSRVIQGITAGIGFLGAGEILRTSGQESGLAKVHGLTSAAAIWVSAALGIAAGCGFWQLALIAVFLCFLVLKIFKRLEIKQGVGNGESNT